MTVMMIELQKRKKKKSMYTRKGLGLIYKSQTNDDYTPNTAFLFAKLCVSILLGSSAQHMGGTGSDTMLLT